MNNFDQWLDSAWQQAPVHDDGAAVIARVERHRRRSRWRRGLEVALSLLAIGMLLQPLWGAPTSPAYWLVMPFFVIYLPLIWLLLLRARGARPTARDASRDTRTYAYLRLSQLRVALRELWLARAAVLALIIYALVAMAAVLWLGDADWRASAARLLAYAALWTVVTFALSRRHRRRYLREYRTLRRLAGR